MLSMSIQSTLLHRLSRTDFLSQTIKRFTIRNHDVSFLLNTNHKHATTQNSSICMAEQQQYQQSQSHTFSLLKLQSPYNPWMSSSLSKSLVQGLSIPFQKISASNWMENVATWLIKRTFQPSIIRKRRKQGFLKRHKSVGGRRMLKRRMLKGRKRLAGC